MTENVVLYFKGGQSYIALETNYKLDEAKGLPNYYTGKFNNIFIKIVEPRLMSSRVWSSAKGRVNQQQTLSYNYCLISSTKKLLSKDEISVFTFNFPVLFWVSRDEKPKEIIVENKLLKISAFTNSKNTIFRITSKKSMSVEEIIGYRTRFERFFTSFTDNSVHAHETTLWDKKSYALLVSPDRTLDPEDEVIEQNRLVPPKEVMDLLLAYVTNFKKLGYATHLHASYVEYGDRKIYLESRLSVLFAGIDALYSKLSLVPTDKVASKIKAYDDFISEIEKTELAKSNTKIVKFLKKDSTKNAYTDPVSFQTKLNVVYDFVDATRLNSALSERVNTLRNNIAHGNDYNFDDFVNEWTDPKTSKVYPAVRGDSVESISDTLWRAISKLAKQ